MFQYIKRNRLWLYALMGGLVITIVPLLINAIDPSKATVFPQWLSIVGITLSCLFVGIGAMVTDTASSRIVQFVGTAAAVAAIVYSVFA